MINRGPGVRTHLTTRYSSTDPMNRGVNVTRDVVFWLVGWFLDATIRRDRRDGSRGRHSQTRGNFIDIFIEYLACKSIEYMLPYC